MPTYQYECDSCGHAFERFQSMNDEPLKRCPECRCKIKRLIGTGAGIIFKGSGFYETDYRSSSYNEGKKKEESISSGSESKGSESESSKSKSTGKTSKTDASKTKSD
jgi:putative FmdB family regulatory protein